MLRPLTFVLLALVGWAVLAGLELVWARSAALAGQRAATRVERVATAKALLDGSIEQPLAACRRHFVEATRLLGSPILLPVRFAPVVGRQLRAAHALTGAADDVCAIGGDAARQGRADLALPHGAGPDRVAFLRRLSQLTGNVDRRLSVLDFGPSRALVGPVAHRRNLFLTKLARLRRGLRQGQEAADGVATVLDGPRRYVVLAANNAEMRAGSGMFLSVGALRFDRGAIALEDFRASADVALTEATAPAITDGDLQGRWGYLHPNREWRNLATTPRFDATAALASKMWEAGGHGHADGVLALDPLALQAVMAATGPVDVGGRRLAADQVVEFLLHDQYLDSGSDDPEAAARKEQLGTIARSVLDGLQSGSADTAGLVAGLGTAARGRHVLAWAAAPAEEQAWAAAGVDGRLQSDSLGVAVLNQAGNKLDQYLHVVTTVHATSAGGSTHVRLEVALANDSPKDEPGYIIGPNLATDLVAGEYSGLVAVTVPAVVRGLAIDDAPPNGVEGPDGPATVIAVPLRLRRGERHTTVVRFDLPADHSVVHLEPSARVPHSVWQLDGRRIDDDQRHLVQLSSG